MAKNVRGNISKAALVTVALAFGSASNAQKEDSSIFDLMDKGLVDQKHQEDRVICEKALYSHNFDRWLKAWLAGRDADADREWPGVLTQLKGARSLKFFISRANTRFQFLEGDDRTKLLQRGGQFVADKQMIASSEKVLGKSDMQVASMYAYLSDEYESMKNWKESIDCQQKALRIAAGASDQDHKEVQKLWKKMTEKFYNAGRYEDCKVSAKRVLELSEKYQDPNDERKAREYLSLSERALKKQKGR